MFKSSRADLPEEKPELFAKKNKQKKQEGSYLLEVSAHLRKYKKQNK